MGPGDLARALCGLKFPQRADVLVGLDPPDDAGVVRLSDELALIQTVDFFTPIVDEPYHFGQIAVANALSDVWAMGGRPLCAMNIAGFPSKRLPLSVLHDILRGGLDKLNEAEVALVGGHTVEDPELKYGLAVSGLVHPERFWGKQGLRAGDALVLSKPLGTGVLNTAIKAELVAAEEAAAVLAGMATLNRRAAEIAMGFEVHAATDVTGFGLVGHAAEMLVGADLDLELSLAALPLYPGALAACEAGLRPGGLRRNREYREAQVELEPGLAPALVDLLYDPQTSGGLLVAVPAARADELARAWRDGGVAVGSVVARVVPGCGRFRVQA